MKKTGIMRTDCIKFAKLNGLQAKGDKQGIITVFNPTNNWVDCFEGWQECYTFFKTEIEKVQGGAPAYRWAQARR